MIDVEKLQCIIEEDINPALSMHNGFIVLDAVENYPPKVFISFFGGCQGCPSSIGATLNLITSMLREDLNLPELEVFNTEMT